MIIFLISQPTLTSKIQNMIIFIFLELLELSMNFMIPILSYQAVQLIMHVLSTHMRTKDYHPIKIVFPQEYVNHQ